MPRAKTVTDTTHPIAFGWHHFEHEGELSVDVAQTVDTLIVVAPVAGVASEDLSISIDHDVLTIRGKRHREESFAPEAYLYQECYWGAFSRSIILPAEVQREKAQAAIKNGMLTVRIPKVRVSAQIPIEVIDES